MATNYKNTKFYNQTTKDTVPASTAATGTITTIAGAPKEVVGSSTLFLSQAKVGGWIYIAAQNEIRKITSIYNDTSCEIDNGFTTVLTGSAFAYVPPSTTIKQMTILNLSSGASATVDGATLAVGTSVEFKKQTHDSSGYDMIDPVVLDAAATTCQVTILK